MKINMGKYDRTIRIIVGLAIIVLGFVFKSFLGLLGLILLVTATIGVCPLYLPFGISTKKKA